MENNYNLINFKVKDREYIERQLKAFCCNFNKGITIEKRVGYYKSDITYKIYVGIIDLEDIYYNSSLEYIYKADGLDELKGWLYGMVQANNGYLKLFKESEM